MRNYRHWPSGALSRPALLVATEKRPSVCKYPVGIYINADGSWFAAHFHGGRHDGLKHPVQENEVTFTNAD